MRISIFGLGYVGCILTAGYSHFGFNVVGVDIEQKKIEFINSGKSPVIEKGIEEYIARGKNENRISATNNTRYAIINSNVSFITVGTPSLANGEIDLTYTIRVCESIGHALKEKNSYHLIVFKSTLFPGTVENKLIPIIESLSNKKAGIDFGVCHNPEFLREGEGLSDFFAPSLTIIGELDKKSGDGLSEIYKVSEGLGMKSSPIIRTNIRIGEMIKYVNNSFHAMKVAFANEIGNIAMACNVDSHEIMDYFCMERLLNISTAYLKPGAPYGGSCLTKDLSALRYEAKKMGIKTTLLDSIEKSNNLHIEFCANLIEKQGKKSICILGLSFKEGTDDIRSSPIVKICEILYKRGHNIKIYDESFVNTERFGVNKRLLEGEYDFIKGMLRNSLSEAVNDSEVIVIKNNSDEYKKIKEMVNEDFTIIDFVRIFNKDELKVKYIGVSW
ncbi:MAG: nucleotide sugar dehydrogenase [Nanoarchaeota archaeon]